MVEWSGEFLAIADAPIITASRSVMGTLAGGSQLISLGQAATGLGVRPNGGVAPQHGGANHNDKIDKWVNKLQSNDEVTNIRKNQQQVDVNGNRVGTNRPDLQFDRNGKHYNLEWDNSAKSSARHRKVVTNNDRKAISKFWKLLKYNYMAFNELCFSILFEEKKIIIGRIGEFFFDRNKLKNINILSWKTKLMSWVDPKYGQLLNFFLGGNDHQNISIFFSNSPDGWKSMARSFSKKLSCKCIQIRISFIPGGGMFEYELMQSGETIRIIQLIQDPKWKFFAKGNPLPYEIVSYYENSIMKNKFNLEIIKKYLKEEGIDFDELLESEFIGVKYETLSWDCLS